MFLQKCMWLGSFNLVWDFVMQIWSLDTKFSSLPCFNSCHHKYFLAKKCTYNERTSISIEPTKSWYTLSNAISNHSEVIDKMCVMYFHLPWCSIANYFKSCFLIVSLKCKGNFLLHWKTVHCPLHTLSSYLILIYGSYFAVS